MDEFLHIAHLLEGILPKIGVKAGSLFYDCLSPNARSWSACTRRTVD